MTVPRPLGTPHWEALKGYTPYSQHRPRNRSESQEERHKGWVRPTEVLEGACGRQWLWALGVCATQCGWVTSCWLTFSPSRHMGGASPLTTPSPTLASSGQQIVGRSDTSHFQTRAHSLPCCIQSWTRAMETPQDGEDWKARPPHWGQLPWRSAWGPRKLPEWEINCGYSC